MKKTIEKKRRRLQRSLGDRKEHYRLYKAGKTWLIAGIATVTFGVTATLNSTQHAFADDEISESATPTTGAATAGEANTNDEADANSVVLTDSTADAASTTADAASGTTSDTTSSANDATANSTSDTADTSSDTTASGTDTATDTSDADSTTTTTADSTSTSDADTTAETGTDSASTSNADSSSETANKAATATNDSTSAATTTDDTSSNGDNTATDTTSSNDGSDTASASDTTGSTTSNSATLTTPATNVSGTTATTPDDTTVTPDLSTDETASVADSVSGDTTVAAADESISVTGLEATTTPVVITRVLAASATPAATSIDGVSTTINGGAANESGTVIYNTTTATATGTTVVNVSGAFNSGDVLTVTMGSNGFTINSVASVSGATTTTGSTTVNNVSEPQVTVTFNSDVSAASFNIYYSFNNTANNTLATGDAEDAVPVTVALNGATVATNTVVVDKTYSANNGTANLGYNLFNAGSSTTITGGLIQNGTVVQDITWTVDLSGNRYPGDYSTIPTNSNITTLSSPSTLTFNLPSTVEVTAASLDSSLTAKGMTVTQTGNTITVTYPEGMTIASLSSLAGNLNVSISAVTTPTTTTTYTGTNLAMTWNVDGSTVTVTDSNPSSRSTLLQYTNQTVSAIDTLSFNSNSNSDLSTFDDSANGSTQLNWTVLDSSNYAYGGTLNADLNVTSSNADAPVGIKSVSGLSDANLAKMGLSNDISFIFTTASGATQTVAYVSGTGTYATSIGTDTDPVTSVQIQENTAMTTPVTTTQYTPQLTVGLTSYNTSGVTTVTAASTATNTLTDGSQVTTKTVPTTRGYGTDALSIVNSNTPAGTNYYNLGDTATLSATVIANSVNSALYSTGVGLMVSDSGATAEAYEKANPITVVVIAPEYTSFASDDTITASLVGNSNGSGIASSADAVTITHLDNLGDQQVISISGLDNYLKNSSISIPVVVNADAPAGAAIASSNTIFVQPSATLSGTASNGTKFDQLTTLGSVTADLNAGNLYNVTNTSDQILGTVIASATFNTNDSIQGSADSAAQVSTGTINVSTDSATGKTILYNGTTTALTDSNTTVSLIDPTTNTQSISLTGPVTVTTSTGATVTGATVTYYKDGAVVTDPTTADSFSVSNVPLASKATTTVSYNLMINSDQLTGITTGKSWQYTTAVQSYNSGTLAAGNAVALGTTTDKTMTLQAVHTLTDTWYSATEDADGNYVQGTEVGSYTNVTGTVYSGTKVADITGAAVGQAMPDDSNSVLLGIYDVSSGTLITDPTAITMVENLGSDDTSVVGSTYYVVTGPRYSTQTTDVTYTVNYSGAGDATPAAQSEQVTWTGTTDATTGTTTWVADSDINAITTPDVTGYTASADSVYGDTATTSTAAPTDQTTTVTYTANTETVTVHYVDADGESLADDTTLTGAYNTTYTTSPATVTGYHVSTTPINTTGTYQVDNADVTYVYSPDTETVTVSYVDQNNQTIHPSTTQSGAYKSAYETAPLPIDGYTLTTTPANATGTYDVTNPEVVYVYTPNTETVTISYVDQNNQSIQASTTQSGAYNSAYTTAPATIEGYTLTTTPTNATGTYGLTDTEVVYVYSADPETVIVRYEDTTGKTISPSTTLDGNYNEPYSAEAATISGYTLNSYTEKTSGTFGVTNPDVVYVYTADPETLTVRYEDSNGQSIVDPTTLEGVYNGSYTTEPKTIEGYTLASSTDNTTGTYTVDTPDVVYTYTADPETVTVIYQNTDGQSIANAEVLTGDYATSYESQAKTIAGYTLTSTPTNATGTYGVSNADVVYTYTADSETVTVRYEDTTGKTISDPTTLTGAYGTDYAATPATIAGYTLNSYTEKTSGTFDVTNPDVVYVYTANPETVTVRYEDTNGNSISNATTLTGNYGTDYAATPKTLTGYTLNSMTEKTSGTYAVTNPDVVYVYTADPETVTVRYEDSQGNPISDPTTLDGNFNETYTTAAKTITGYTLSSPSATTTGTYGVANADVVYTYTADPESVTVRYEDTTGNVISAPTTLDGNFGTDYAATPKDLTGYTLNSYTEKTSGTFGVTNPDVVYVYAADSETVTVRYEDTNGNTISDPTTLTGNYGTDYAATAKTLTGYTLNSMTEKTSGTYDVTNPDVVYVYTADPETVTVHYVDADGNTISTDTTKNGSFGGSYTTAPKTITGYTLSTTPTNADGIYTVTTPDVTYVYTANTETVTVHYVDANGETLSADTTEQGAYGTAYTTQPATVTGYTLTATPTNADGTYGVTNADIVYYYTQNAPTTGGSTGTDSGATGSGSDATGTGSGSTGTDTGNTGSGSTNSGSDATSGKGGSGSGSDVTTTTAGNTGTTGRKQTGHVSAVSKTDNSSGHGTSGTAGQAGTTGQTEQATDLTTSTNAASADGNGSNTTTDTNGDTNVSGNTDTTAALNADGQTTNNQLPQTNETNQSSEAAEVAGLGILATLAGLFGFKRKRKHDED